MDEPSEKLINDIKRLKQLRRAVIVAHNYQLPEVQDIADFTGDSLELSRLAAKTDAEVIVFCGVSFMAETAKILSPQKTVIVPDPNAGCPLANMITPRELQEVKSRHPNAAVVCYVNSSAETKALSDICCTSANAVKVVLSIEESRDIIFVPDKSLGDYASRQSGRSMILCRGYCPTHHRILPEDIEARRREHPQAVVIVHPECLRSVVEMADHVASTSGIIRLSKELDARQFVIGTEIGILHRLKKEAPGKEFYAASMLADCPNMKLNDLPKILWALEDMENIVELDPEVMERARGPIEKMVAIG